MKLIKCDVNINDAMVGDARLLQRAYLQSIMKQLGVNQAGLSELIGVSVSYIRMMMQGRRFLTRRTYDKMVAKLRLSKRFQFELSGFFE